ncbi:MAG: hypothetical protein EDX89_09555 [Acidobacteria bacterium]|nr:MAG: hypothetical protein EDX89_09555 [Acidobacteriota bacterium]MCE7959431.1 hypothetical protein [Acidobacteria bacterium ACB2]
MPGWTALLPAYLAALAGAFLGLPQAVLRSADPAATPVATPTPVPGEVRVAVTVVGPDRKTVPGKDSAVWIPGSPRPAGSPPPVPRIASKGKRFEPRVTVVPVGTTVDFPNLDRIYHNAFSLSEGATFDLGLYRNGASKPFTFQKPGVVRLYCNIHPQMAAFIVVADGGVTALAGAGGIAVLPGVPPGRHPLHVWDERGGEWSGTVEVLPGQVSTVPVRLDASAYRELPHKNKHGKDYPPPEDDENRY